jgi:hypothetical protein
MFLRGRTSASVQVHLESVNRAPDEIVANL